MYISCIYIYIYIYIHPYFGIDTYIPKCPNTSTLYTTDTH